MKRVLFIDRDGTIIEEPPDEQVDTLEKMVFLPQVIGCLKKVQDLGYSLVLVSNQDGLGTSSFPESDFKRVQEKMIQILHGEGIIFESIFIDHHFPEDNHPNRKPGIGMLTEYLQSDIDLNHSWVIGDRFTDVQLAQNLGCRAFQIKPGEKSETRLLGIWEENLTAHTPFFSVRDWLEIVHILSTSSSKLDHPRLANITRNTHETQITLKINLDGMGKYQIQTGIHFYNHMLEQLARHSGIDIYLQVLGDLEIDEHHTIEDSAIALGQAFREAMGTKLGMERYGFVLPMDEALVSCALDFSGRSYFIFKGQFDREYVGDFPTEMLEHWMKSFSDHSGLNLNLEILEGSNTHHKVEASFKALARCIKQAIKVEGNQLPSTKGIL